MFILLKYLLHDMIAQYRRTLLVLVTLALSAASLLASVAISGTMVALGTSQWRAENGYSDILIAATPASPSRFFNEFAADRFSSRFEYAVYRVSCGAELELAGGTVPAAARGYNLEGLLRMAPVHFSAQRNLYPFEGNKAIVSRRTAEEYGVSLGDILTVGIGGNRHAFEVCAVAYAEGPFAFEADTPALLLPYRKLQACMGELGRVDAIYAKLKDPAGKGRAIRELSDAYRGFRVSESYSEDQIRLQSNRTAVPFVFMSVLLCFMAVYVLFTLFKGAVADRLPLMGIFRAVGAYRRDTWAVMVVQSLVYGLFGGILSWAAGAGMLLVLARMLNQGSAYQYIPLTIGLPQMLLALLCAVAMSLAGAAACLASEKDSSICMQIKGTAAQAKDKKARMLPGLMISSVALAVVLCWQNENGLAVYVACVVCMLAGMALLSPGLYAGAAGALKKLFRRSSGAFRIALMNISTSRDFAVTATIVSIIVATSVVVSAVSFSDREGSRLHYERIGYRIELTMGGLDRQALNLARQVKGVEGVCGNYYSGAVEVEGQTISIYRVQGVTPQHAEGFVDYQVASALPDPFRALESGRNILLTRTLQSIYKVNEGDRLVLKLFGRDGKYREAEYTIIGFFDDYHTKLGRFALISQGNFIADFAARGYDSLYIRADDARTTAKALEAAFEKRQATIRLVEDDRLELEAESERVIEAMGFISTLAAATGILGIVNITLLSFMRRRREIGLFYAVGMTAGDIMKCIMAELFLASLMGFATGALMGLAIVALALPRLIFALQIAMRVYIDARAFWLALPAGGLAATASSALCLLFLSRSNPMDGLRQEE